MELSNQQNNIQHYDCIKFLYQITKQLLSLTNLSAWKAHVKIQKTLVTIETARPIQHKSLLVTFFFIYLKNLNKSTIMAHITEGR